MFFSKFQVLLLVLIVSSVQLAPVDQTNTLFDIIESDNRTASLRQRRFTKYECSKEAAFSETLCITLYDLALKFDKAQLKFPNTSIEADVEFCEKLIAILPDKPSFDESVTANLKKYPHNVTWLKDTFQQKSRCADECVFTDYDEYKPKVKPVCFFIFNQYRFLKSQNEKQQQKPLQNEDQQQQQQQQPLENEKQTSQAVVAENIVAKIDTKPTPTSVTQEGLSKDIAAAFVPILPANAVEVETTKNATQPEVKETAPLKPVTQAAAPVVVNKSADTAATKADTVKSDLPINSDDDQNLEDKEIFDEETQSDLPEKDIEVNVDEDDEDDPDADFPPADITRDNNRNNFQNNNKLNLAEVEAPETVRMEMFEEDPDSNFFTYLCAVMFFSILLYILYHNRQKILGLLIEGRRGSRRQRERSRGGSKAAYSKLDCNLEEAITSKKSLNGKSMDIIY